jgi:hypothetical protein
MLKPLAFSLALALASGSALAATCTEAVERFAREHEVARAGGDGDRSSMPATPPVTMETRGMAASDKLAETGGVLQPPDVGRTPVLEPPPTANTMPTAPRIEPGPAPEVPPSKVELDAATRVQVDSLLTAARQADKAGDSHRCYDRLGEAQKLAGSPPS